jgi:hypothetical protein
MLALGALLLAGAADVRAADDVKTCIKESGDAAIDACSRAIKSRRLSGHALAYEAKGDPRAEADLASAKLLGE